MDREISTYLSSNEVMIERISQVISELCTPSPDRPIEALKGSQSRHPFQREPIEAVPPPPSTPGDLHCTLRCMPWVDVNQRRKEASNAVFFIRSRHAWLTRDEPVGVVPVHLLDLSYTTWWLYRIFFFSVQKGSKSSCVAVQCKWSTDVPEAAIGHLLHTWDDKWRHTHS